MRVRLNCHSRFKTGRIRGLHLTFRRFRFRLSCVTSFLTVPYFLGEQATIASQFPWSTVAAATRVPQRENARPIISFAFNSLPLLRHLCAATADNISD